MISGTGLAILVNANAKRGGRRIAAQLKEALPSATVRLTRTLLEMESWLRSLESPRCILSAGGDGTAAALMSALDRVTPEGMPFPNIGLLPLGTGNGWANSLGAPKLDRCLEILRNAQDSLPMRRVGAVVCDGHLAQFAGCGWDSMVLNDFRAQVAETTGPAKWVSKSAFGYLSAAMLRTVPRALYLGNPRVVIENLGGEVYRMGPDRRLQRVEEEILYDGPFGCASVGTCPEYGYGFKALPFAERFPGAMNLRVYLAHPLGPVIHLRDIWTGVFPLAGATDWFATAVRMTFSRPMPLQVGGDAHGMRRRVEYRMSPRALHVLDWRRLL
ncbi:MAG: diacylglycerol kinase family protein [Myxococcales bacterium]